MKKVIKMLLCGVVAIAAIACTKDATEGNRLATPDFTANVQDNAINIAWASVDGAAYYEISINESQTIKTEKTAHRLTDLEWGKEYTIGLTAISADANIKNSATAVKKVEISDRVAPHYREWYPQNSAAATAISNNGRYVTGGFDRNGFLLDLSNDKLVELAGIELYDVADNGVAVGSNHTENAEGVATIYINGTATDIDLSSVASNHGMSCCTGITPDGEYIVGWYWEYDSSAYYAGIYGDIIPFCYDVLKDRVSIPMESERLYNETYATAIKSVAPDRTLVGYEQSMGIFSIIWKDEYTPYEYIYFDYDENYKPIFAFGDTQNIMSQSGRYIYGKAIEYTDLGENPCPAIYDRNTSELICFTGAGYVSAVADNGVAFLNDVPYYIGTTSYVVDLNAGEPYEQKPIIDWLLDEHSIDLYDYIQDGVITIGTSEDGSVLLGITNTMQGWLTYVIDLNGTPME